MIIDCHGHYTTAPTQLQDFRTAQHARLADSSLPLPSLAPTSDEEVRESVENHQLKLLRQRGADLMLLSPKASGMEHHVPEPATARAWAEVSNDLVHRVTRLFPAHFAGVCQLPQAPAGDLRDAVAELRRCVRTLGFVGCNLNPDPSGGHWSAPPLTDPYWFPLYEAMTELDVPAMIHVSSSHNPAFHTLGAHYLNADTTVFMQLLEGDLFARFPALRFVLPHGGGAVPFHWGRYRGLAERLGRPDPATHVLPHVHFDTCVYHQPGVDLLREVIGPDHLLFASEMLGAVRGADLATGIPWDDTKRYVDRAGFGPEGLRAVYEDNARRVYPLLDARLRAEGR